MLPASDLTEILTNLSALKLDPTIAAAVLGALAPLLRSSGPELEDLQKAPKRPYRRASRLRKRAHRGRPRHYQRKAPSPGREAALAAWRKQPDATPTEIAKAAKISRSTAVNAHKYFKREARREVRKAKKVEAAKETAKPAPHVADRRQRARRFLKDALAQGPKQVQAVEAAAAKAHIDDVLLAQARGDLGVIATRADSGVHAVQWSLPG